MIKRPLALCAACSLLLVASTALSAESNDQQASGVGGNLIAQTGGRGWQTNATTGIGGPGTAPALVTPPPATAAAAANSAAGRAAAKKKRDDLVVILTSPVNTTSALKWQRFYNSITLKPGQEQLSPLFLTVTNGDQGPPFQSVRLSLSGRQFASDKDFKGNYYLGNLAGTLTAGDNQLLIDGYGPPGAKITWKLSAAKPIIATVTPTTVDAGGKLTIAGKNFLSVASANQVTVGGKSTTMVSANSKQVVVTVPMDAPAGDQDVIVTTGGIASKALKVKVNVAAPELTGCDYYAAPPGFTVTVSGKNLGPKSSDVSVSIAGASAQILSVSPTSVSFLMPNTGLEMQELMPVVVMVKGVQAKGNVRIMPNVRPIYTENLQ